MRLRLLAIYCTHFEPSQRHRRTAAVAPTTVIAFAVLAWLGTPRKMDPLTTSPLASVNAPSLVNIAGRMLPTLTSAALPNASGVSATPAKRWYCRRPSKYIVSSGVVGPIGL